MPELNVLAILLATVVVIVISAAYYAALGAQLARLSPAYTGPARPAVATVAVEVVRSLVVAVAVATLAAGLGLDGLVQALLLGLALWVAFPVVLLTGSVFHERVPPLLASIHSATGSSSWSRSPASSPSGGDPLVPLCALRTAAPDP